MKKRPSYTKEFKLEAVRLLERGDKPTADLAREPALQVAGSGLGQGQGGCLPRSWPPGLVPQLDPFKPQIDGLLAAGVWNAVVIWREILAKGYGGAYSMLIEYIRPKRVLRSPRATVRFETGPGRQTQVDWGEIVTEIGGMSRKVYLSAVTLGFARRTHAWAFLRLDAEHLYESLVRAFAYFGGTTHEVLLDNPKTLVLQHRLGESVVFHPRFLYLCTHYGVRPRACRPYRFRYPGQGRAHGRLSQALFLRALPAVSVAGPSEPATRGVAGGESRPTGAWHRARGGHGALPA
jgi:hypothetical protein